MSFINALSSRSQAPPSPSTPCVLQPTNIPDNSPFDMDASYWPPFQPSASSSSTPSPVSPADLPSLIARPVSSELVNYLVDRVQDAVDFGLDRSPQPAASAYAHNKARNHSRAWRSRAELDAAERERRAVLDFTTNLLRRAEVSFSIVLGALVYIERAKPHLSIAIEGEPPFLPVNFVSLPPHIHPKHNSLLISSLFRMGTPPGTYGVAYCRC